MDGVTGRPRRAAWARPDEDAGPPPFAWRGVDLSGDYRVEPWRWLRLAASRWADVAGGYAWFVPVLVVGALASGPLPFLRTPLACGASVVALRALRGEPWTFGTFFAGFRRAVPLVAAGMLSAAVYLSLFVAISLAFQLLLMVLCPDRQNPDVRLFVLCLGWYAFVTVAALTYFAVRLSFVNWLLLDQRCGVMRAINASWRMTEGHVLGLLGYYAILWLIGLAGLAAFGVGLFAALPLVSLAEASAYLHATRRRP